MPKSCSNSNWSHEAVPSDFLVIRARIKRPYTHVCPPKPHLGQLIVHGYNTEPRCEAVAGTSRPVLSCTVWATSHGSCLIAEGPSLQHSCGDPSAELLLQGAESVCELIVDDAQLAAHDFLSLSCGTQGRMICDQFSGVGF